QIALVHLSAQSLIEQAANVLVVPTERIRADAADRFLGGVGQEDRSTNFPLRAIRFAAGSPGGLGIRLPLIGDHVARDQTMREGLIPALARDLHAARVAAPRWH